MDQEKHQPVRNRGLMWLIVGIVSAIVIVALAVGGTALYKRLTTTNYELVDAAQPLTYKGKQVTAHGVASLTHRQATVTSMSFGRQSVVVTIAHYQFGNGSKTTMKPKQIALAIYQLPLKQFDQTYAKQLSQTKQNNVKAINTTLQTVKPEAGVYLDRLSATDQKRLNIDMTSKDATYEKLSNAYESAGRKASYQTHFKPAKRVYQQAHHLNKNHTKQFSKLSDAVKYMQTETAK